MAGNQVDMGQAIKPSQALTIAKPKRGRPSKYTEELASEICERHREGESLNSICEDSHMPSPSAVRDWADKSVIGKLDEEVCGRFSTQFAHAREMYYHGMAEAIIDIADDSSGDVVVDNDGKPHTNYAGVQRTKHRLDARKWVLARALPHHYGEHVSYEVEHKRVDADPQDIARALLDMGLDAKLINQEPE